MRHYMDIKSLVQGLIPQSNLFITCTAELRKQLFCPGALVNPLLLLNVILIRELGPWLYSFIQ